MELTRSSAGTRGPADGAHPVRPALVIPAWLLPAIHRPRLDAVISVEKLPEYLLPDFQRPALAQDAPGDVGVGTGPGRSGDVTGEEVHVPAADRRRGARAHAGRIPGEHHGSIGFPYCAASVNGNRDRLAG